MGSAAQGSAGQVTVASNLPDGEAAGGGSTEEGSDSRTLTNFDVSETSREVLRVPGAVKRLTVAVLVADVTETDAGGVATVTPRSAEELASLGELVGSAVGLDTERGDRLTIRSMTFDAPAALGSDPALPGGAPLDLLGWARPILLALVAIALGLFVVRPILRPSRLALPEPASLRLREPGVDDPPILPAEDPAEVAERENIRALIRRPLSQRPLAQIPTVKANAATRPPAGAASAAWADDNPRPAATS